MYFSKILPYRGASSDWDPYRAHQTVWKMFSDSPKRDRDFLFRLDYDRGRPRFFAVSARAPHGEALGWQVDTKPYAPKLAEGERLVFALRANPVVKRQVDGRQTRHDVVMDRKSQLGRPDWRERATMGELLQEAGGDWLRRRAARHGFEVVGEALRVSTYQQHRFRKKGPHRVAISTLDYDGLLRITDLAAFTQTLFNGIGPAKGFGCGLLLVRRP